MLKTPLPCHPGLTEPVVTRGDILLLFGPGCVIVGHFSSLADRAGYPWLSCYFLVMSLNSSCCNTPTTTKPPSPSNCTIYYSNCCSLVPKLDYLRTIATSATPTIMALCETWLDDPVPDSSLFIPNYYSIRRDRSRHGGGLLLYVSEDVPSTRLHYSTTLELLFIELKLRQGPLLLALYYRPPSSTPGFADLEDALVSLVPSRLKSCILLGDFNVDLISTNQLSSVLVAMLSSFHFTQVVSEPTRVSKKSTTLIDQSTSLIPPCCHPVLHAHLSATLTIGRYCYHLTGLSVHLRRFAVGSGITPEPTGTPFVMNLITYHLPLMILTPPGLLGNHTFSLYCLIIYLAECVR